MKKKRGIESTQKRLVITIHGPNQLMLTLGSLGHEDFHSMLPINLQVYGLVPTAFVPQWEV